MAFIVKQRYKLDIAPKGGWVVVYASQHDDGAREIEFEIKNQGNVFSIPASINVSVQGIKANHSYFSHSCSYSGNVVTMALADDMTDIVGKAICVLKFTNSSQQKLATAKFILNVDSDSSSEGIIIDTEAEEIFNQMLNEIRAQAASVSADIAELQSMVGSPLVASTVSAMTDHNKIYVYTGSESGYTNGNWYYWNGSAWTSGGVYNSVAFETDPTFTQSGQAADAKVTGDRISDLKSAIEHVYAHFVYPTNRLNPNTFTAPGYVIDLTNGAVVAYGTELCVSDYIPIEAGVTYTSTMRTSYYGSATKFPVYDENKNFVKSISPDSIDTNNNRATFTSNIYGYTRVVVYKTRITDTMFVVGDTYPDEFIQYSDIIYLDNGVHINAQNVDGLNDVLDDTGVFDQVPASDILQLTPENKYIGITGVLTEGAYHATIENVVPGDKYTLKCQTGSAVRAYVIVGSGGNVMRYADADSWTTNHDYDITVTITSNEAGATLYINTIVQSYLGAYYEHTAVVINGNKNIGYGYLFGKMIAVDGDSICKGEGYSGGYAKIIAKRYSMGYQNLGVSGGTIAAGTQSGGNNRHWICRSIQNLSTDADYIIIEGGVNDASLNVPMGAITSGYNATLDDATFCGAMESICKQLVNDFAGKKIGYIAVHQMTDKYRNTNTDLSTSYYLAALKICQKWGVPVCDLNTSVPPFAYLGTDIKNAYTYNGDGWHPNEAGYKKYYVDKITSFLEAL